MAALMRLVDLREREEKGEEGNWDAEDEGEDREL